MRESNSPKRQENHTRCHLRCEVLELIYNTYLYLEPSDTFQPIYKNKFKKNSASSLQFYVSHRDGDREAKIQNCIFKNLFRCKKDTSHDRLIKGIYKM